MPYRIAGIDVHKKILAVVVSNVEIESEYQFERRMFGSNPEQLRSLAKWLLEQEAEEVVMESTAQNWKPVCAAGQLQTLPCVLPVPGCDKRWYLYAARVSLSCRISVTTVGPDLQALAHLDACTTREPAFPTPLADAHFHAKWCAVGT